jgi:hypothetical protein
VFCNRSIDRLSEFTAIAICSTRLIFIVPSSGGAFHRPNRRSPGK